MCMCINMFYSERMCIDVILSHLFLLFHSSIFYILHPQFTTHVSHKSKTPNSILICLNC